MRIEVFDDLYDATLFIETEAEMQYRSDGYFKAELIRTDDGRWRVGLTLERQMEFDV